MLKVGDHVIYTDPTRKDHAALVTTIWTQDMINVLFVSSDEAKQDQYGRQIERETSVGRYSENNCHGRCFRDLGVEAAFKEHPAAA